MIIECNQEDLRAVAKALRDAERILEFYASLHNYALRTSQNLPARILDDSGTRARAWLREYKNNINYIISEGDSDADAY